MALTSTQDLELPDVILAGKLGRLKEDADYRAAKAGEVEAAVRLARRSVTDSLIDKLKHIQNPLVVGVISIESSGENAIPQAAAAVIADRLGGELVDDIVQSSVPMRTDMDGLDRIFARPLFDGFVASGRNYVVVDDTLTQGATLAALSRHITCLGGNVAALVALSGKSYGAKLAPDLATIAVLRERFGDLENDFISATGVGFDQLTHSEIRYLVNFSPSERVRDCITAAAR
ncbi:MAG: phosphoribosyltransferase [Candidatus Saccharibacteria bacterium]|nr:phosphoribosyltransferase [Rhodoferax sp.]